MNGESPVTGKIGLALDLDGNNEYICIDEGQDEDGFNCDGGETSTIFDNNSTPAVDERSISLWYNADTIDDSNKIRSSAGVGLNWTSPIGPLSFTLSNNLSKASTLTT